MRKPVNVMKCIFPVRHFFFSFHALSLVLLDFPQRHQAIYMSCYPRFQSLFSPDNFVACCFQHDISFMVLSACCFGLKLCALEIVTASNISFQLDIHFLNLIQHFAMPELLITWSPEYLHLLTYRQLHYHKSFVHKVLVQVMNCFYYSLHVCFDMIKTLCIGSQQQKAWVQDFSTFACQLFLLPVPNKAKSAHISNVVPDSVVQQELSQRSVLTFFERQSDRKLGWHRTLQRSK